MTETDATKQPLEMPTQFLPKLERARVYLMMKDMVRNVILDLPKDHLKQMKIFAIRHLHTIEASRLLLLVEPGLDIDHPCTFREARCLQQDGVLPTVTLVLMKTPPVAAKAVSNHTLPRNFYQQDFEGLKYAYKATMKEVHITPEDRPDSITMKCFNAVRAFNAGHQGKKQGLNVLGAPGVYRVLLLGPRGSGRSTQAMALAKHFGLVFIHFDEIFKKASAKDNDIGAKIRKYKTNFMLRGEVVKKRLQEKDCIDHGWVMVGYPTNGNDFELLDGMATPPNRIIFLNMDLETCRVRTKNKGFDLCSGNSVMIGSGPRVVTHPDHDELRRDYEWDLYFTEQLAELRASAGLSAVEIDATDAFDKVQVKVQAAVIAAPHFDIECCTQLRSENICAD